MVGWQVGWDGGGGWGGGMAAGGGDGSRIATVLAGVLVVAVGGGADPMAGGEEAVALLRCWEAAILPASGSHPLFGSQCSLVAICRHPYRSLNTF